MNPADKNGQAAPSAAPRPDRKRAPAGSYTNRGDGDRTGPVPLEYPGGDRGQASGRNLEQLEQASGTPGHPKGKARR